ncbi:OmpA family protein [Roseibacillus ishigakijimensis]|uniref:OmpA family protein n=1 Tax=Roseibacillus ishigakijimensis TaxID=454146 RepID=A0A934VJB8_9BACT|nr:OmpA family protein [Roseibacillus ishigakijimensis]MBK1832429.1 OmpA family protein [Roseibacillus ishigakijimensis]
MKNKTAILRRGVQASALSVLFALVSCTTTNPYTGQQQVSKTAAGAGLGTLAGAGLGAIIGNNVGDGDAGRGALIGAGIGALAGGGIGQYMDQQEALIRRQLQGTGVSVTRQGNDIILNMPNDVTFSVASANLQPRVTNTLDSVALVLNKFDRTLVTVEGHTDSDGGTSYNQNLSEQRALSVANYLSSRRVNPQRLIVRGYGESQPIASNSSQAGKAQNRRVEIHIVPQQ